MPYLFLKAKINTASTGNLTFRNHSEKSINSILDYISTSKQMELLQNFYETTLDALRDAKVVLLILQMSKKSPVIC